MLPTFRLRLRSKVPLGRRPLRSTFQRRHIRYTPRAASWSWNEHRESLNTLATFSQHCDNNVAEEASTPTEVSSLRGEPPHVAFEVAASRFRVLIIWDESIAGTNLAIDVDLCLEQLPKFVDSESQGLVQKDP